MELEENLILEEIETVSDGDVLEDAVSVLTVEGSEDQIALLTDILAQVTESNETIQLSYSDHNVSLSEKPIDNLTFDEFMLLGIFLIVLADFILNHIGRIFRCMK